MSSFASPLFSEDSSSLGLPVGLSSDSRLPLLLVVEFLFRVITVVGGVAGAWSLSSSALMCTKKYSSPVESGNELKEGNVKHRQLPQLQGWGWRGASVSILGKWWGGDRSGSWLPRRASWSGAALQAATLSPHKALVLSTDPTVAFWISARVCSLSNMIVVLSIRAVFMSLPVYVFTPALGPLNKYDEPLGNARRVPTWSAPNSAVKLKKI